MSATTALVAALPEAAAAVSEEEQKGTKETKELEVVAEGEADDTTDVSDDDTVVAADVAAEEVLPESRNATEGVEQRNATEGVPYSAEKQREEAAARVRQAARLPPGLRERLAAVVERGGQVGGEGQTLVSLDEAIRAVAESLPHSLRLSGGGVSRPEHPGGESFFSGRTESEISDQLAEEIARGQLARSGLLRGQRVRVVD